MGLSPVVGLTFNMTSMPLKQITIFSFVLLASQFATFSLCSAQETAKTVDVQDPIAQEPPAGKLPHALLSLSTTHGTFAKYAFLVDKKARTLTVWENDADGGIKLVSTWPTDIGQKPGDKLVQGDHRTPEGIYFFQRKMDGRKLSYNEYGNRIFTLDYPNYFDKLEKKTGNGIWFHAIPETKSLLRGSRGCVVVRNEVIDHLSKYIELKRTPMVIVDEVKYMERGEWRNLKEQLSAWIEQWRKSWGGKDFDSYMAQYSEKFQGLGMNKEQWRRYKQALAKDRTFIQIDLKDVQIFNQGPKVVFRFLQSYKSDKKEDFGAKIIYTLKNGDVWEIVGETWESLRSPTISTNADTSEPRPVAVGVGSAARSSSDN